jgi:hypothetical protein
MWWRMKSPSRFPVNASMAAYHWDREKREKRPDRHLSDELVVCKVDGSWNVQALQSGLTPYTRLSVLI